MRTVRSAARARNQPRGHLAVIVVGIVALLAVLAARAAANPYDPMGASDDDDDARAGALDPALGEPGERAPGRQLFVPITNAMVERVVTIAPAVAHVVAAAYRAAGLAGDPTIGWRRRSRWSSLIPMVSVRAGQNQAWRDVDDPTISHGVGVDVRASWHLDQLLFDPNEPRIAMLDVGRRRARRQLAAHTIRLYFDWVSARAAADRDVRAELDAQEKAAELDELTAGWFSQALAKRAQLR